MACKILIAKAKKQVEKLAKSTTEKKTVNREVKLHCITDSVEFQTVHTIFISARTQASCEVSIS